jgi:hypothetical protein
VIDWNLLVVGGIVGRPMGLRTTLASCGNVWLVGVEGGLSHVIVVLRLA